MVAVYTIQFFLKVVKNEIVRYFNGINFRWWAFSKFQMGLIFADDTQNREIRENLSH